MAETILWCYHTMSRELTYAIPVARDVAEQTNSNGQPLIGGEPVTDSMIGPPPAGFRPRYITLTNTESKKQRRLTVFSEEAPLWKQISQTIELREKDGSVGTYKGGLHSPKTHEKAGRHALGGNGSAFVGWLYSTNQGHTYVCRVAGSLVEQKDGSGRALVGGSGKWGAAGLPVGLKPRTITVHCPENGKTKQLIAFSTDAPLWTGAVKSIDLPEGKAELLTYAVRSKTDETWSGRRPFARKAELDQPPEAKCAFGSSIESDFWEVWQRSTKIRLTPQHPVLGYRIDFAHLPTMTAIEIDGYYFHSDQERFRKDRQRDRELTQAGWRVIRFDCDEVSENVRQCVEQVIGFIRSQRAAAGGLSLREGSEPPE